jgi:hypothetical protein
MELSPIREAKTDNFVIKGFSDLSSQNSYTQVASDTLNPDDFKDDNMGKAFEIRRENFLDDNIFYNTKFYRCIYEGCSKAYKSKENLKLHIKTFHLKLKPYKCEFCSSAFTHRNGK